MVNEFKTKIDLAREMLDVLKGYFRVSRVVFDSWYWSEKLVRDNVVSELKSNLAQGRPQGSSRRWRDTSEWDNLESTTPT
jgi:Archaeal putative transposase ISC1217.